MPPKKTKSYRTERSVSRKTTANSRSDSVVRENEKHADRERKREKRQDEDFLAQERIADQARKGKQRQNPDVREQEAAAKRKAREESLEELLEVFRMKKLEGPTVPCGSCNRLMEPSKVHYVSYDRLKSLGMLTDAMIKERNEIARQHFEAKEVRALIEKELEKLEVEQIKTEESGRKWNGKIFGCSHKKCKFVKFDGEEYCLSEFLTYASTRLFEQDYVDEDVD